MNQDIRVSVDAVVFGYAKEKGLQVLLIQRGIMPYQGSWALPGGLVGNDETLEKAVQRELQEETGVLISYLEQLYTFSSVDRDPRNRVISIAYYVLVAPSDFVVRSSTDASNAKWFDLEKMPPLAFDHKEIVDKAWQRLKSKITYEPIGFELLGRDFAFSELHSLYEKILDKELDRRNFKKKMLSFGFVEETAKKQQLEGSGRPGYLYHFNKEKYFDLKAKGFAFEV